MQLNIVDLVLVKLHSHRQHY